MKRLYRKPNSSNNSVNRNVFRIILYDNQAALFFFLLLKVYKFNGISHQIIWKVFSHCIMCVIAPQFILLYIKYPFVLWQMHFFLSFKNVMYCLLSDALYLWTWNRRSNQVRQQWQIYSIKNTAHMNHIGFIV